MCVCIIYGIRIVSGNKGRRRYMKPQSLSLLLLKRPANPSLYNPHHAIHAENSCAKRKEWPRPVPCGAPCVCRKQWQEVGTRAVILQA
ncbi:hypothetical protein NDU88_005741 [Pleurodeles waltl]|uniref:Uncharacterized protein n=1 Tax=Pleurodeles waltl TaxID=8319 RepID=A0AAV7SMI2_PLEWA|nr:hypothetical protein NDU88_005741 [Pleurodeles waltl]